MVEFFKQTIPKTAEKIVIIAKTESVVNSS